MKVLITGVSGFVGSHVFRHLESEGHEVWGTIRESPGGEEAVRWIKADSASDYSELLSGFDALVHCAGVAHNPTSDPVALKALFEEGNLVWTRKLAAQVADSEVKVMVHISSIAAAGTVTLGKGIGFREDDATEPETDYGRSKRDAEPFVEQLKESGKLGVNLRPPLIYGAGARGNWAKITSLAQSSLPIPFGSVRNSRSYLGIENLCDLVSSILSHSEEPALSGTYHVADENTYSLREIVMSLRAGFRKPPRLLPFPPSLMRAFLVALGRKKMAEGLFDDLILDTQSVKSAFRWSPPQETLESIEKMAAASPPR